MQRPGRLLRIFLMLTLASEVLVPVTGEASPATDVAALAPYIAVLPVASGLQQPVFVTHAGDGSGRMFILERAVRIRILRGGTLASTPFLDIRSKIASGGGEQGLLGLAFHPAYASNGRLFVYYPFSVSLFCILEQVFDSILKIPFRQTDLLGELTSAGSTWGS